MKHTQSPFRMLLLAALLFFVGAAEAKVITGTVTDQTGETIISASVVVKGTTVGTVTDFDGNYTLDVPDNATTLVFSYIGLQTQEVEIKGNVINVTLAENSEVLEEVVVTGYGTTKKRDLVTSVASVSADQLKDVPVTTAAEALQGKLAGVSVTTTEGSPDADVKIRIRGGMSLTQSSEPLYIVDGFPVSSISDIAPSDIASMDVLKDAAATAIYGAQGANGVIIITTKDTKEDGDKFKFHVDYTGYMGWKQIAKKYDMMSAEDFIRMQYEFGYLNLGGTTGDENKLGSNFRKFFDKAYQADNKQATSLPEILAYWADQPTTDWQDETFGFKGLNSNHNFVVSGGNKMWDFNLTYNRVDDASIMYGSDYNRNNVSFKAKVRPVKGLTIAATARFTNTEVIGSGTNTADDAGSKSESRIRNAVSYTPLTLSLAGEGSDDDESFGNIYDPITSINDNYKEKVDNKYNVSAYVEYKFLKNYKFRSEIGYEGRRVKQDRYYGPTAYYSRSGEGNSYTHGEYGNVICTDGRSSRLKNTNTFNMDYRFKDAHHLGILIGEETTVNKSQTNTFNGFGYDVNIPYNEVFSHIGEEMTSTSVEYIAPSDNLLSFFARADYDYMGKYYIVATMRADASTKFAKGHQWGYFPSVAVSWRMIDEDWMEAARKAMSNLKFRLSVGTSGNNNVDLGYLHFDYLSKPSSYMQGFDVVLKDGGSQLIAANPNLKWETTFDRNFGIDYGFFNERLSGAIDLYWKTTSDLILLYKMAAGGYNYQYRNIGSTDNKGVEFSVNGIILDHKSKSLNYTLSANANIAFNKNTVIDLGGMDEYQVSAGCLSSYYSQGYEFNLHVGESIGNLYGYKTNGWYTVDDFASFTKATGTWKDANGNVISTPLGNAYPGMTKIVDVNEDGEINAADITKIGNTMPLFNGGFGLSFNIGGESWGKVDMNAQFTYSYGNDVLNMSGLDYSSIVSSTKMRNNTVDVAYGKRYSLFDANGQFLYGYQISGRGALEGEKYQEMAALVNEGNANAVIANPITESLVLTDNFVEDASFLRLSSVTLGYSLPQKWIKKAYIKNFRLFFTASNLFCLTNYSGSDPEVDTRSKINPLATGVDYSAFPKARAFNFGLNLAF